MAHVFHEGELAVQARAGDLDTASQVGRMVGTAVPAGARGFLARQSMAVAALADVSGHPRCTLLFGAAGFLEESSAGTAVRIDRSAASPLFWELAAAGATVGLLAIELETRRRLRVNGTVASVDGDACVIHVVEAFPNCPKYIQRRRARPEVRAAARVGEPDRQGAALDDAARALIAGCDTAFVASRHPARGMDASHRGGDPGFVTVLDSRTLRVPDYVGNRMYTTLGNLAVSPQTSLLLVDFEHCRALEVLGSATLQFDVPERPAQPTGGTGREWQLAVSRWEERALPAAPRFELLERSPLNPHGGG
jgi:predicted pyridoxine 5'-phosphate oxidase superfamily flavin-nucleotide-binding protein